MSAEHPLREALNAELERIAALHAMSDRIAACKELDGVLRAAQVGMSEIRRADAWMLTDQGNSEREIGRRFKISGPRVHQLLSKGRPADAVPTAPDQPADVPLA